MANTIFIKYDDSDDEIELSLPKPPINIKRVDDLGISIKRDMNAGIDYNYLEFKHADGTVVSWKFFYPERLLESYNRILALLECCEGETGGGTGSSPVYRNMTFVSDGTNPILITELFVPESTKVFVMGQRLARGIDYTENTTTNKILLTTAPEAGIAIIVIDYQKLT